MPEIPEYLTAEILADWCEYRQKDTGRKKWTPRMERAFLRECERLHNEGYDVARCIDKAMNNGWLMPYGRDDCKRPRRHRETAATDLRLVETADRETARNHIKTMKERARG